MRTLFSNSNGRLGHFIDVLKKHYLLLVVPPLAFGFLAGVYGLLKADVYTARQSLVIRDDLIGDSLKPGRFDTQESLKSAQDTILEIVRSPELIRNAMQRLGKPSSFGGIFGGGEFPSETTIESVQGKITIGAPNGGEPGKTDIFVLSTKESSRERSGQFIEFLLEELETKIRDVRSSRLQSMERELEQKVKLCRASFEESSGKLQALEKKLGPDLGAIRSMSVEIPNESSFTRQLQEIENEKRIALDELENARQQLVLINRAMEHPEGIPPTTSELLGMQPTLVAKFNDLAEAQKTLAIDRGKYQASHHKILGDQETIDDLVAKIKTDLETAAVGLESQVESLEALYQRRSARHRELVKRLDRLADLRVEYEHLNHEVKSRQAVFSEAYGNLVDVRSLRHSAANVDILTRVGAAQVSTTPDGLGTKALVLAAGFGGFLLGCGLLILVVPPYAEGESTVRPTPTPEPSPAPQPPASHPNVDATLAPTPRQTSEQPPGQTGTTVPAMSATSETSKQPAGLESPIASHAATVFSPNSTSNVSASDAGPVSAPALNRSPIATDRSSESDNQEDAAVRDRAFEASTDEKSDAKIAVGDIFDSLSASFAEHVEKPELTPPFVAPNPKKDGLKKVLDDLKAGSDSMSPGNDLQDSAEVNSSESGEAEKDNILADLKASLSEAAETAEKKREERKQLPPEASLLDSPFESAPPAKVLDENENTSESKIEPLEDEEESVTPKKRSRVDATVVLSELEPQHNPSTDAGETTTNNTGDSDVAKTGTLTPIKRPSVRPIDLIKGRNSAAPSRRMTATQAAEDLVKQLRSENIAWGVEENEAAAADERPNEIEKTATGSNDSQAAAGESRPATNSGSKEKNKGRSHKERLFSAKADIDGAVKEPAPVSTPPVTIPDQVASLNASGFCLPGSANTEAPQDS